MNRYERVTYKGVNYVAERPISYVDSNTLTVRKQKMALFLINQGFSLDDVSEKLAVSRELLYIWYTDYLKTENLSETNNNRKNGGVRKKVEATNVETCDSILFESVADCARHIGCADSTISCYARSGRKYGKWQFKYVEE